MAEEALVCFGSLEDSIPAWITDLESILTGITVTQKDLILANRPFNSILKPYERIRTISSSLTSRSKDGQSESRSQRGLSPLILTAADALRLSQRKRKTDSTRSGDEVSLPKNNRGRTAAIVYYDGNSQKRFEQLVRAVGSSRNSIRKGKMSAKIESMARTGSSSSSDGYGSAEEGDDSFSSFANLSGKGPRSRQLPTFGRSDNTIVFDKVDAHLEKAQALCERAAHQVLRDGDCTTDINNATQELREALSLTNTELPQLRKRAQRATDRKKRAEERRRAEKEAEEERRRSASELTQKILYAVAATQPVDGRFETGALEVDDGSDDDGELNISAMQFSKFSHMRSRRLPAC